MRDDMTTTPTPHASTIEALHRELDVLGMALENQGQTEDEVDQLTNNLWDLAYKLRSEVTS